MCKPGTVVTSNMHARNFGEAVNQQQQPLLKVESLNVAFGRDPLDHPVVRNVSLDLYAGRCLAIVGESGSGKSVTADRAHRR